MLTALSNWAYRTARVPILLVLLLLYALFPAYILPNAEQRINQLAGQQVGIIDLLPYYQSDVIWQMLDKYGQAARQQYAYIEVTTDIAYPIVYTALFVVILSLLYRNRPYRPFATANLLPLGIFGFDIAENICIVTLLNDYPAVSYTWAVATGIFTSGKWLFFALAILAVLYGILRGLYGKMRPID